MPVAWYVTWDLYINSPKDGYGKKIAGQNQKRYTDKAAAMKYLEGRKKSYSHLFTEVSPPVPKEYERHFTVYGALLPGYTVEGQEPVKSEHTAAEVSDGGISTPERKKSLLCWESCLRRNCRKKPVRNRRRQIKRRRIYSYEGADG